MSDSPTLSALVPSSSPERGMWQRVGELLTLVRAPLRIGRAWHEQRLAARATAELGPDLRQLAEGANDVFWIYEPQRARFLYVSPAYEREWLRSSAALYADPGEWLGPVRTADRPSLQQAFARLAQGDGYALEYRETTHSGQDRWVAERTFPLARGAGQALRIAGISRDITSQKRAHLAFVRSDRRKDEFLATLAHELRNPVSGIRLAAALLMRGHADPAAVERAIAIVERQACHLTRLVDDALDVARVTRGKIRLRSEVVRIGEVIDAAVEANRELLEARALQLRVRLPDHDVCVHGDAVRLTQVFSNLLHNAAKFSVDGGIIEVEVDDRHTDKQVAVSVRDEGVGIAADVIDSVFDLFTQAEHAAEPARGGLGIGLAVVRSLVELHGGTVSVRSDGMAKGSEFVVVLPATDARPSDVGASIETNGGTGRRVLVVDDDRDASETMQALLELEGHHVALASSGQAALDQATRTRPDVVILDIGLPDIAGDEVARRLKADTNLAPLMLVALTGGGHPHRSDVPEEFDHHLVKPADPAMLLDLVRAGARHRDEAVRHARRSPSMDAR